MTNAAASASGQFTGDRIPDVPADSPVKGQFAGEVSTVPLPRVDDEHPAPSLFASDENFWNPADISDDVFSAPIFQEAQLDPQADTDAETESEGLGTKAARGVLNIVAIIVFSVLGLGVAAVVVGYLAVTVGPWTVLQDGSVVSRTVTAGPINALPSGTAVVVTVGEPAVSGAVSLARPVQPPTAVATISQISNDALGQQVSYAATCTGAACPSASITVDQSHIVGEPASVAQLPTWITNIITTASTP